MEMSAVTCPSCGSEVPVEAGQHALAPDAGVVACPTCGAAVRLDGEGGGAVERAEEPPPVEEDFSGHETIEGVMDELREKEGGPQ
jgi:endogenous inhibitor of DNA gyrase (YacG/DUF329 family)